MDWTEMDNTLTLRAQHTLGLRDRADVFRLRLEPAVATIRYESVFSVYYGHGVDLLVFSTGDRVARLGLYHGYTCCYLGTHGYRGKEATIDTDEGLASTILAYLQEQ